jgi:hypothetical protein
MPSTLHEALVLLFRDSPRLATMLVARVLGVEWPEDADIQVTSAEFAEMNPPEYRADLVLRVPGEGDTRETFIIEVQLDIDPDKHFTWPQYVTAARTRFRSRATLVVVTVNERVARWCAQPIVLDLAGNVYRPVVIGAGAVPVITDLDQARTWPELAVLSAIAHGPEPGAEVIAVAAMAGCALLDNPQSTLYVDLIYDNLNVVSRHTLDAMMEQHKYTYQSDFAKKYVAEGIEQGIEQGLERGIEQGLERGIEQGLERGITQGHRTLLRELLRQRFGELPVDVSARLDAASADTLTLWARRVLTAATLAEVFDPESR